jgi:hypothetical protein
MLDSKTGKSVGDTGTFFHARTFILRIESCPLRAHAGQLGYLIAGYQMPTLYVHTPPIPFELLL